MIVNYLILALGVAALTQPTAARRKVAVVFTVATLAHCIIGEYIDGGAYYLSAAILASAIINITLGFKETSPITQSIHRICLVSIVLNAAGWVIYRRYFPPEVYNLSFIFLYLWAIMVLMKRDRRYAGDNKLDSWAYYFRFSTRT
jgi:urea transporter